MDDLVDLEIEPRSEELRLPFAEDVVVLGVEMVE